MTSYPACVCSAQNGYVVLPHRAEMSAFAGGGGVLQEPPDCGLTQQELGDASEDVMSTRINLTYQWV